MGKYEYLTGEDLDYQPIAVEKAKFEYSPLGRVFNNRGMKEKNKKERLVKRVKNIEDKNEELLQAIKGKTDTKSKTDLFDEDLTLKVIALIKEIKSIEENVDYDKLSFTVSNKKVYSLDSFKTFETLIKDIRNKNIPIDKVETKQNKLAEKLDDLRAYIARGSKFIDLKESAFTNVKNLYDVWKKNVNGFKIKNYCHFLKSLVRKLIVIINKQIF